MTQILLGALVMFWVGLTAIMITAGTPHKLVGWGLFFGGVVGFFIGILTMSI